MKEIYNEVKIFGKVIEKTVKDKGKLLAENQKKANEMKRLISKGEKSKTILKKVFDTLIKEKKEKLAQLVSYGLASIFGDKYSFEVEVSEKSKRADFVLVTREGGEIRKDPLKDSIGGGILSFISFLFRVYYIIEFDLARVMFMDEQFSQISAEYIPAFSEFLSNLCKEHNFTIVLNSHVLAFSEYADKSYRFSPGAEGVVVNAE